MINYGDVCCTRAWEVLDDRFAYAGMSPALRFFFTGAATTMWHNSFSNFHESSTPKSFLIVNNLIGIYLISPAWRWNLYNKKKHILLDPTDSFIVRISYFGCGRCQLNAAYIASHSHSDGVAFLSSLFSIFLQSRLGTPSLCYRPRRTGRGDQARFTDRQRHIPAV